MSHCLTLDGQDRKPGCWYRVEFHDTVCDEYYDGVAGSKVKNELMDETLAVRQLASDESPAVWIKDTPPVARPGGIKGARGVV